MITLADLEDVILTNYGLDPSSLSLSLCPPHIIPEEETN